MIERLKDLARRRLVRNILALYGVQFTNRVLPFIVIPFLTRVLGPTGFGLYAFAQALAVYLTIVVEYGFEMAGARAVARDREDRRRLGQLVAGALIVQLILALMVAAIGLILGHLVPEFRGTPALLVAALAFAVCQGFNPVWYFVGQERVPVIAAIDAGAKVLATIAIFALVREPEHAWRALAAYAGAAALTTGIGYALVLREVRPARPSLALIGSTFRIGFPMFLMRSSVMMHTTGNVFLLGLLAAPAQVAFFAAAEKLCRPFAWLMQPINTALLPRLANLLGHDPARADRLASLAILFMVAGAVGLGLGIWLLAPWFLPLYLGPGFERSVAVLQIMAVIVPLIVLNSALINQWLVPHGLDWPLNVVIVSGTLLNLALVVTIVPTWQAIGMAWVTVTIEAYILTGLLIALRRNGLSPIKLSVLREGIALFALPRR
jgi:polysaccharide transporter, PST family